MAMRIVLIVLGLLMAGCTSMAPVPRVEVQTVHVPVEVLPEVPPELMLPTPALPRFTSPDDPNAATALDEDNTRKLLELLKFDKGQIDGLRALLQKEDKPP
jgi:hypothetical protein